MALLPPIPVGVPPGSSMWTDWYEKIRFVLNNLGEFAALNGDDRITVGVDTTDDIIVDDAANGLVLKSPDAHYWRATISNAGVVTWTDLGTTKP